MIRGLSVYHLAKAGIVRAPGSDWEQRCVAHPEAAAWRLETCQRWLLATHSGSMRPMPPAADIPGGVELLHGVDAYRFLLEVATGLASQLAGETNIFGQLKAAWGDEARKHTWLQWLFADAKEIRAKYLSEVGGASYGRLVRQLLRHDLPSNAGPVLVVGAGDMAETVCPWLRSHPIRILNRTRARAEALAVQLSGEPGEPVEVVDPEDAEAAWKSAAAIIVCVPFDATADAQRVAWLRARAEAGDSVPVIHLGGNRPAAGAWQGSKGFRCLDDVYALQQSAGGRERECLARAARACAERARHRGLGCSLSHPHGWEDLPDFFPLEPCRILPAAADLGSALERHALAA